MVKIRVTTFIVLLLLSWNSLAQVNRYMVFFTDKTGTPHSVSSPLTFLSQKALDRRAAQNISVVEEDLPVAPSYVQGIRDAGATVLYKTKWMNGVLVECTSTDAENLTGLSFVNSVQYVAPGGRPPANGRIKMSRKFKDVESGFASTDVQLSLLGMDKMHSNGYKGEGILIAVLDAGFPGADTISYFKHVFTDGRFDATTSYDFVSGGSNVFRHHNHGTNVWSTIAAFKEDVFVGGAYKANFVLFVTEDAPTEYRVEEYNWLFAAEHADSLGVDVITTSLGYSTFDDPQMNYTQSQMDGETTVITRASKIAANKGMAVVASAGNEGNNSWGIITAPADGKNVLAVGAVTSAGVRSSFSSLGPSADGRFKPDVAALGSSVSVLRPDGIIGTSNGTSFAGPLTASLVAGYWQKYPELSAQQVLDTIRSRGHQFNSPDNFLGFGIPSFHYVITSVEPGLASDFIKVFPNPAKNHVMIEFPDKKVIDFTVSITDARGSVQTVYPMHVEGQKFMVDISEKKNGLYLIKIIRDSKFSIHKILKVD